MRLIEQDLKRWGAWARGGAGLNIKPLTMYDDGTSASANPAQMGDDEAEHFDPAVAMLRLIDKELYDVIRLHYVYRLSYNAIAKIKGSNSKDIAVKGWQGAAFIHGYLCGYDVAHANNACLRPQKG